MRLGIQEEPIRIGYIDGQPKRINERVVDGQWISYLGNFVELVKIPPLQIYKLFGGTTNQWLKRYPDSLRQLAAGMVELCAKYRIRMIYMNLPSVIPYLLMARNVSGLDLGLIFIAHSVGSEFWLRQWVAIAPLLTKRDVLLVSTQSSQTALLNISKCYHMTKQIPLCIDLQETSVGTFTRSGKKLLVIGRIEDVKNIDLVLEVFANIRENIPNLHLTVAGEFTGTSQAQMDSYRQRLEELAAQLQLGDSVNFPGAVTGEDKETLFKSSDLLLNLSTDPGETFGYNLVEAKVWGVPVVCANWDGFQEIVVHEKDGLLVDCNWEGEYPVLDKSQIVQACLNILQNSAVREEYSKQAASFARQYDYRQVMPKIVSAVVKASRYQPFARPDTTSLISLPISELSAYYRIEQLQSVPFGNERLIDVASGERTIPLNEWMPLVKPVIRHFAGRVAHVEL